MGTFGSVLLVGVDPVARRKMVEALRAAALDVVIAWDGVAALRHLRAGAVRPCLVVLDLRLPLADVRSFRLDKAEDPTIASVPVLFICSLPDGRATAEFLEAYGVAKAEGFVEALGAVESYCRPEERAVAFFGRDFGGGPAGG